MNKRFIILFATAILLLACCLFAITAGNYRLPSSEVIKILLSKIGLISAEIPQRFINIVWEIRLPRIILAVLTGVALSSSGAVYQSCFRNPLVEPYILGVSSGAAFGAAIGIVSPVWILNMQSGAFIMALVAVTLSYLIATSKGATPTTTLVLSGIITGSVFMALVAVMKYISDDTQLREITFWLMGGLYNATWRDVYMNGAVIIPLFLLVYRFSWRLNILSGGDEEAKSLGIAPGKYKLFFIVSATLMTAVCVSTTGIIAWVGLMMPHAARMLVGPDNRWVLPVAAFGGGSYMLICDTIARTVTMAEIPIGIITAILGAPYLIWLLRSKGKSIFYE